MDPVTTEVVAEENYEYIAEGETGVLKQSSMHKYWHNICCGCRAWFSSHLDTTLEAALKHWCDSRMKFDRANASATKHHGCCHRVSPCKNKEKKGQCQKVTFLWRNMKEWRVVRWFLLFLASILFLGPLCEFFFQFSKLTVFKKCILKNQFYHLFVAVGLDKFIIYLKYSILYDF